MISRRMVAARHGRLSRMVSPTGPGFQPITAVAQCALWMGLTGMACTMLLPGAVSAQVVQPAGVEVVVDIPAGTLGQVLNAFARATGVELSANDALLQGRDSAGLQGRYSVQQGFAALLAAYGLQAVRQVTGNYVLRESPSNPVAALAPVTVTAEISGMTEGTGSYISSAPLSTATPLGLTLRETPQSVSVITNQRMEDQGLTSIAQVMAQVPGITQNSLGSERAGFSSRGYSIDNYQLDGVNTNAFSEGLSSQVAQSTADMAVYDRIEVLRGSSGLMSGAGDPSGIINMVRKKPTADFQASVEGGIGSWSSKRVIVDLSGPLINSGRLRGRAVAAWQDGDSAIDHYGNEKKVFYGVLEADLTESTLLTIGVDHQHRETRGAFNYGFPLWYSDGSRTSLPASFNSGSRDNRFNSRSTTAFATLEQALSNDWRFKLSVNRLRSSQREDAIYIGVLDGFANPITGDGLELNADRRDMRMEIDSFDINVRGPFTLLDRQHELVLGADYQDVTNYTIGSFDRTISGTPVNLHSWDNTGLGQYGAPEVRFDNPMRQKSLYAAGRFALNDRLKLIAGTKVFSYKSNAITDNPGFNYYVAKPASESNVWTPYGGLVYDINDAHTAYLSYSAIYKPQTAQDRYGALIDPREGNTFEMGLKSDWLYGRLSTAVAAYQIRQDNLTETDPGYFIPGTTNSAARAIKGAKTQGIDIEATGALTNNWNISASWTYSQSKNAKGEHIRTNFPRHMVKLWSTYRLPGDWNRFTVGGGVNWQSNTYSTVSTWQVSRPLYWEQKSYAVASLMARYDLNDKLSATLNINNVFDKKYIQSVSDWWYAGYYGEARSVALNVKYRF